MKAFLQRWIITTLGVLVAAKIVPGIGYQNITDLFVASLLLGILNAFLRPVMMILTLPLLIVTLGLFTLVINALLLAFVGWLVESFHVAGFWAAFFGGLIISIVSVFANLLTGAGKSDRARFSVKVNRGPRPPPPGRDTGSGPVIDV